MKSKYRIRKTFILLPIFIVFLFVAESAIAIPLATNTPSKTQPGEPRPAASYGTTQYKSIQEAIYNAPRNATVTIEPGTYTEIITINKSITLQGDGPETTILAPTSERNSYAVKITAEGVTLTGLTVINNAEGLYSTGVKITKARTTITRCIFRDTPIGIAVWGSHTTISQCSFLNCSDEGIAILGSNTSTCDTTHITACVFSQNCDGIELQRSSDNLIEDCRFSDNTHAGIDMIESANTQNTISRCDFSGNQGFGLYCAGASQLLITHCSFSTDDLTLVKSQENTITASSIAAVHLLQNSSLIIDHCDNVDDSHISTQTSRYDLLPRDHQSTKTPGTSLSQITMLTTLLSRLHIIQLFYRQLAQLRM
jgi:parallel beta-helix repeat protein